MSTIQRQAIEALVEHGSQNAAAAALGWKRTRVQSLLRRVQARALTEPEAPEPPPVHGEIEARGVTRLYSLEERAPGQGISRYILTSAQNNTRVHGPFLANLEAYAHHMGARIMVARFSYNKGAYGAKATKAGRAPSVQDFGNLWYAPEIAPYVCDDPEHHGSCRYMLAPDLMWCAEQNIEPTAVRPLSDLQSYSGPASGIFPHAKMHVEPVAVIGDRPPKFNYTTGTVTQRNYIAKKAGIKAEFHHCYGALLVEVDNDTGDWWARQLNATDDGSFYDLTRHVSGGAVTLGHRMLALQPGDIHALEIDPVVASCLWDQGGVIDILRPEYQFWHDTHSHRNRSHHETKQVDKMYEKWVGGPATDSVEHELRAARELMLRAYRDWCQTVVVSSNHDRHGERWLNEASHKTDFVNADFLLAAQREQMRAIRAGEKDWMFLEWAIRGYFGWNQRLGCVRFLKRDEQFPIGPPGHEVECGQHGDEGANGARGNPQAYAKMPVRLNVGHIHSAWMLNGVTVAGVCNRRLPYAHGPSSWSISHTGTYQNGKRVILTQRAGKLWL